MSVLVHEGRECILCVNNFLLKNTKLIMERIILLLIAFSLVQSEPQDNSDITYVKIQPLIQDTSVEQPSRFSAFRESRIENIPLQIRSYTLDLDHTRNDPFIVTSDSLRKGRSNPPVDGAGDLNNEASISTEATEVLNSNKNQFFQPVYEKQYPGPKFYSKLSYFKNSEDGSTTLLTKFISSKKKFRSRCRCERIWNCPKIQISVPRCPEEYFLCCF